MSGPTCPACGGKMTCDTVDIGVGEMQTGKYGCDDCQLVEGEPVSAARRPPLPSHEKLREALAAMMERETPGWAGRFMSGVVELLAAERERCRLACLAEADAYVNKLGPAAASARECAKRIGALGGA